MNDGFEMPSEMFAVDAVELIEAQVASLEAVIAEAKAYGTSDFASEISLMSLQRQHEILVDELFAARLLASSNDAALSLSGASVHKHAMDAAALASVIGGFQRLVLSVAQALTGEPTARAPIPASIRLRNSLLVTATFASSFGISLRMPTNGEAGELFDNDLPKRSLDVTAEMFDDEPSPEFLALLRTPRVKGHYSALVRTLARTKTGMQIRTRHRPYGYRCSAERAQELVDYLELLKVEERRFEVVGVLVGGSVEKGRYELTVDEDHYAGKVSELAERQMHEARFGEAVVATLVEITTDHEDDILEPKVTYFLESIRPQTA